MTERTGPMATEDVVLKEVAPLRVAELTATAASYGVDAHEAHDTDELTKLLSGGIADRARPTLINVRTTPVLG